MEDALVDLGELLISLIIAVEHLLVEVDVVRISNGFHLVLLLGLSRLIVILVNSESLGIQLIASAD